VRARFRAKSLRSERKAIEAVAGRLQTIAARQRTAILAGPRLWTSRFTPASWPGLRPSKRSDSLVGGYALYPHRLVDREERAARPPVAGWH
jgi:hypothetical protein